jgi:hypothetical protein
MGTEEEERGIGKIEYALLRQGGVWGNNCPQVAHYIMEIFVAIT